MYSIVSLAIEVHIILQLFSLTVEGSDFNLDGPNPLTFMPGDFASLMNSQRCSNISLIDDMAIEGDHSFSVHISAALGIMLNPVYAIINIEDINCMFNALNNHCNNITMQSQLNRTEINRINFE